LPNRLENVRKRLAWLESPHATEGRFVAKRLLNRRTFAFDEVEAHPHRLER